MIVKLEPWELESCDEIARRRNEPKEKAGIFSNRFDQYKPNQEIHNEGVQAEYAVAKLLELDLNTVFALHGDNGVVDLDLPLSTIGPVTIECERFLRNSHRSCRTLIRAAGLAAESQR